MAIFGQIWPYIIIYGLGSEAKGIAKPYFSTLCWKKGVPNVEKKHIWPHLFVQMHRHNDPKTWKPYDQKNMQFWGRRYIYIFLFVSNAFQKRLRRVCAASPSWTDWKSMFSMTLGWLHRHYNRHISYTGIEPELGLRPLTTTFLWIDPS